MEWLWHAPDGTAGPPWPKGTVLAQDPNISPVNPQGYACDVDHVIATNWGGFNLNGPYPAPDPPKEEDVKLVYAKGPTVGKVPVNSFWIVGCDRQGPFGYHLGPTPLPFWKELYGPAEDTTTADLNDALFA